MSRADPVWPTAVFEMPFDKDFLEWVGKKKGLGKRELEAFCEVFGTEKTRIQICQDVLHIQEGTLRGRLTEVFRKFSITRQGPGKEGELKDQLREYEKQYSASLVKPGTVSAKDTPIPDEEGLAAPVSAVNWQRASRILLDEQIQRLTTNPLTYSEGIAFRTEQVYVPLGLVQRKRPPRRGEDDVSPEQGSKLYEETEIAQKFEHEEFLESVLRQQKSPLSQGRRLAIVGEPGAGKTTLLQQIGRWLSENIDGAIVIWISLADLQGETLEAYLLEHWLRAIAQQDGQAEASTANKNEFISQCQQERVWLLLDGIDEMQVSSGNGLSEIDRQLRACGLLFPMKIVVSCRSNLWDGNRNALSSFDVYRTLEFSYPEQVEQFVRYWFR